MNTHLKSALTGLLLGDGLSRQNGVQRLSLTTERRINRFQTLSRFSFENGMTTFPEPYVHAFPEKILKLYPGDDCEWLFFSANIIKNDLSAGEEWTEISKVHSEIKGRLGTKTALRNLSLGMRAPESGHDNPHYFDSIGMLRAAAISGFSTGSWEEILKQVDEDITQTHSLDGLWCARAVAAFVHSLKLKNDIRTALNLMINQIPEGSLTDQVMNEVIEICKKSTNEIQLALTLEETFVDRIYCYPYSGPELLALMYASFFLESDPQLKFSISFLHRRHNDSLPPFLGFLLGYIHGDTWLPEVEDTSFLMDGVCIPKLKGKNLLELLK